MIVYVGLFVALAHLILGLILWLRVRKLYSYPGALGLPVLGNLYYGFRTIFLTSMDSMDRHMTGIAEKCGKSGLCFHWAYGFRPSVIVSSPQVVKEIAFHPNLNDKSDVMYAGFIPYSNGPFASYHSDDLWKLKRKEYNTCLKRTHVDSEYNNTFIKCGNKLVDSMLASKSSVDIYNEVAGVTQNAIVETLFGIETSLVYHPKIIKAMKLVVVIGSFIWANPTLAAMLFTVLRPIDAILFGKLAQLRKLIVKGAYDRMETDKCSLSEHSLSMQIAARTLKRGGDTKTFINELQELFFTSTHPPTSALASMVIFFALLPEMQERAWKEQNEIFGDDDRDPTIDDLEQMQFLDRFIKESFRFLAPPFIGKLATGDINISGVRIPSGTSVIFLLRQMRMDPNLWDNPNVFDPDRFLDHNHTIRYSYTPFGFGIRNCPGMYFATSMVKLTLSTVLRRLKIKPVDNGFGFNDLKFKSCIMMEIKNVPVIRVEERT